MSSDIMSRTFDAEPFALIYGGVQKNMGPAGAVMYAVDIEKLGATGRDIPSYLDLSVHLGKDSMFNTPSVFSVYTTMLTLRWLKAKGGVAAIQKENGHPKKSKVSSFAKNEITNVGINHKTIRIMVIVFSLLQYFCLLGLFSFITLSFQLELFFELVTNLWLKG